MFFADDGMLLTDSIKNAEVVVDTVTKVSRECGLNINKEKSNIIILNMRDKPMDIARIKVKKKKKSLGITINDCRNCFKVQTELILEKAVKMANLTYSVTAHKLLKIACR